MSKSRKGKAFAPEPTREIVGFNAEEFMESSEAWARQPTREADGFDPVAMMQELGAECSGGKVVKSKKVKEIKPKKEKWHVDDEERAFFGAA